MRTPPVSTKKKSRWRPIRQIYLLLFFYFTMRPPPLFYFDLLVVWCVLKTLPCPLKKKLTPGRGWWIMDMAKGVTDAFCTPWKICDISPEWVILEAWIVLCVLTWPITVLVSILRKFSVFLCYAANLNKRVH